MIEINNSTGQINNRKKNPKNELVSQKIRQRIDAESIREGFFFLRKILKLRDGKKTLEVTKSILTEFPEEKKMKKRYLKKLPIIFQN